MDLFAAIATDANIAPAFRRLFATPKPCYLAAAHEKAAPRRFVEDHQPSAFGALEGIGRVGSLRWQEVREQEHADHLFEAHQERIEAGL